MALTDFQIVRRSLRARLFSTLTTVLMVAVAVAILLVLFTMRRAAEQAFARGSGNMHILVSRDNSPLSSILNGVFYANAPQRAIAYADYQRLFPQRPDGTLADARVEFAIPTLQGDSFRGFPTMATTPEFLTRFQPDEGAGFRFESGRPFRPASFEVVLGADVARATGKRPVAEGSPELRSENVLYVTHGMRRRDHGIVAGDTPDPATVGRKDDEHGGDHGGKRVGENAEKKASGHGHEHGDKGGDAEKGDDIHSEFPLTVVGVLQPTGTPHDRAVFMPLEASWVIHADETRAAAKKENEEPVEPTFDNLEAKERLITGVYVRARGRPADDAAGAGGSGAGLPISVGALTVGWRRADPTLVVATPSTEIPALFRLVSNVDRILVAMGVAVLVSSAMAITLALSNSMEQRRRQFAVLRVLGASKMRIFSLVLAESAVIGLLGALLGVALAAGGAFVVSRALLAQTGVVVQPAPIPEVLLPMVAGTVALACAAGLLPAMTAYRTSVSRLLRPGD